MEQTGIVGALLDFSFTTFVSTKLIKLIYGIGLLWAAMISVGFLVFMLASGGFMLVLGIIAAPVIFVISALMARVYTEFMIVIFRIAEDIRRIADQGKAAPGAAPAGQSFSKP